MANIQCPNCGSYDTKEDNLSLGCGGGLLFFSFIFLGGGAGASGFYGGSMGVFPIAGLLSLIFGIILIILGFRKKYKKGKKEFECKSCKCEFYVE